MTEETNPLAQSFKPPARVLETINAALTRLSKETGRAIDLDDVDLQAAFRIDDTNMIAVRLTVTFNSVPVATVEFETPVCAAATADESIVH